MEVIFSNKTANALILNTVFMALQDNGRKVSLTTEGMVNIVPNSGINNSMMTTATFIVTLFARRTSVSLTYHQINKLKVPVCQLNKIKMPVSQ